MTNKEAIIVLKNIAWFGKIYDQEQTEEAVCMAINALQAQESCNELATNLQPSKQDADDLISRAAAIDAVEFGITYAKAIDVNTGESKELFKEGNDALKKAVERIKDLPLAQPETHEERTETHACDCISRQAAIDAILAVTGNSSVRELYEHVQEHGLSDMWSGGVNAAIDIIIAVPSAQPKSANELAEKAQNAPNDDFISRKAAIEAMEDVDWYHINKDGQLTHGANSKEDEPLYKAEDVYKVLNDMPSAQPELIEREAYIRGFEQGKTQGRLDTLSAQPERLTDDDFETIRIHLNAYKEKLCNQHRWEEANEYQRIIDRFMAFASAQLEIIRCKDCRWRDDYGHWLGCPVLNTDDDNFCSMAERKTDGN